MSRLFSIIEIPNFPSQNGHRQRPSSSTTAAAAATKYQSIDLKWGRSLTTDFQLCETELGPTEPDGNDQDETLPDGRSKVRVSAICTNDRTINQNGLGGGVELLKESGGDGASSYPMKEQIAADEQMQVTAEVDSQRIVLVNLRWHKKEQLLTIYPDFNKFESTPYLIEFDQKKGAPMILYAVEYLSQKRRCRKKKDDKRELKERGRTHLQQVNLFRESVPKRNHVKVLLLVQIEKARNFTEYDNLHFKWQCLTNSLRAVVDQDIESTHSATASQDTDFHFSHAFERMFEFDRSVNDDTALSIIHLHFNGYSVDRLWRERHHGWASLRIPAFEVGVFRKALTFVRPINNGSCLKDSLEQFFIGGHRHVMSVDDALDTVFV